MSDIGMFGHPKGLTTLFLVEIWERASYYGMRALLVLYMTALVVNGGLGFTKEYAATLYGLYCASVYITPLLGGYIADKFLGARRTLVIGGITIALGHLCMVFHGLPAFFGGLVLIALGTGLLKPNMTTMIAHLYEGRGYSDQEKEARLTAGVNIVYSGINIGAMLAPLLCGFLAQSDSFKAMLGAYGFNPASSWHWGFGAAGIGMVLGLIQYWLHRQRLRHIGDAPIKKTAVSTDEKAEQAGLTKQEWHKLGALAFLFVAFTLFIAISEQAGSSLSLFAQESTNRLLFGFEWPASWAQSINPLFIILLTPFMAWLWPYLGKRNRQPSSPIKFAIGLAFVAAGTVLMVPASLSAMTGLVSPLWLIAVFFLQTVGELCTSPVGLATANQLAPRRYQSLMMGVWFLSIAGGSFIAGLIAGFCDSANPVLMAIIFGSMAVISLLAAAALWYLTPLIKKLMAADQPSQTK